MDFSMKVTFIKGITMETARLSGLMANNMKATGKEIKWTDQAFLSIKVDLSLKEFSRTIIS